MNRTMGRKLVPMVTTRRRSYGKLCVYVYGYDEWNLGNKTKIGDTIYNKAFLFQSTVTDSEDNKSNICFCFVLRFMFYHTVWYSMIKWDTVVISISVL